MFSHGPRVWFPSQNPSEGIELYDDWLLFCFSEGGHTPTVRVVGYICGQEDIIWVEMNDNEGPPHQ